MIPHAIRHAAFRHAEHDLLYFPLCESCLACCLEFVTGHPLWEFALSGGH